MQVKCVCSYTCMHVHEAAPMMKRVKPLSFSHSFSPSLLSPSRRLSLPQALPRARPRSRSRFSVAPLFRARARARSLNGTWINGLKGDFGADSTAVPAVFASFVCANVCAPRNSMTHPGMHIRSQGTLPKFCPARVLALSRWLFFAAAVARSRARARARALGANADNAALHFYACTHVKMYVGGCVYVRMYDACVVHVTAGAHARILVCANTCAHTPYPHLALQCIPEATTLQALQESLVFCPELMSCLRAERILRADAGSVTPSGLWPAQLACARTYTHKRNFSLDAQITRALACEVSRTLIIIDVCSRRQARCRHSALRSQLLRCGVCRRCTPHARSRTTSFSTQTGQSSGFFVCLYPPAMLALRPRHHMDGSDLQIVRFHTCCASSQRSRHDRSMRHGQHHRSHHSQASGRRQAAWSVVRRRHPRASANS